MSPRVRSGSDESTPPAVADSDVVSEVRIGDPDWLVRYGGQTITVDGEELVVLSLRGVGMAGGSDVAPGHAERTRSIRIEEMLGEVAAIQADEAEGRRSALLRAMMASGIDPVPAETVAQARQLARRRERMLASGAYFIEDLQALRGDSTASAARTWLSRRRTDHELITVTHEGRTLIPAFQLTEEGAVRSSVAEVLRSLAPSQLSGWAAWTWFTAGSPWLGGATPVDLLDTDPERVATAAARFAANAT